MSELVFDSKCRFYRQLVAYLTHVCSTFIVQDPDFKKPRSLVMMGGNRHVIDKTLAFHTDSIINSVLKNQLPPEVRLEEMPNQGPFGNMPITDFGMLHQITLQGMFVLYYEQGKIELKARYGDHPNTDWPPAWNFARVVRNACAHNGLHFEKPTMAPVSWRTLTYWPRENGRQILQHDLGQVEVIYLMADMEAAL